MIVVLQAMWIFILVMPVLTEMAGTGAKNIRCPTFFPST